LLIYIILIVFSKGISQSALPYRRIVPTWLKLTSEDVKDQIFKLAKKGLTPSQIGKFSSVKRFDRVFVL